MSDAQKPLIINQWAKGMADSPHVGISVIRNADIESYPGAVKVTKKPATMFLSGNSPTFTADAPTDVCTASGAVEANLANFGGMAVYFTSTGTLPAGLSTSTVYFLIYVSNTTFKVATSYKNSIGSSAGTAIDITDAGTGVHTMHPIAIGTINWIVQDPRTSNYWMLDSNGRVWFVPGGSIAYLLHNSAIENVTGALTNASGQGLVLFLTSDGTATYLFTFRNSVIDVINVFGISAYEALSWTNAWKNLNTGSGSNNSHHAIVGQDNIIYFCDSRYVGSIVENAGSVFAPGNAGTYTYNNQALTLPQNEVAQCLEELGTNLLTGGNTFNKIYPWDRISNSFGIPLSVPEYGVKRMKNMGSIVYILAGSWGNVYTTQGTYVKFFKKIPNAATNVNYAIQSNPITWGGLAGVESAIVFGVGAVTTAASGVYKLYPDGRLIQDNTPAGGAQNVTALFAINNFYVMGYAGGADQFLTSQYTNFETLIQSGLYKVGNKTAKAAYSQVEVQLANPATSGHIRIKYRTDKTSAFADFASGAVLFTADSVTTSYNADVGLTDIENVQIQVEMDGTWELVEMRLYP
jgi:hypothetical protein